MKVAPVSAETVADETPSALSPVPTSSTIPKSLLARGKRADAN
jgi:hypothetical protein